MRAPKRPNPVTHKSDRPRRWVHRGGTLAHLQAGHTITPLSALKRFGTLRLSERIRECQHEFNLTDDEIEHRRVKVNGKTVMSYRMKKP